MVKPPGGFVQNLLRVDIELYNVLYLSFTLPAEQIRPLVPGILPMAAVGDDKAIVSVVCLCSRNVHVHYMPLPSFTYEQINIRTYVHDPDNGNQAVYFLRSAVSSRAISLLTRSTGVTWEFRNINRTQQIRKSNVTTVSIEGRWQSDFSIEADFNQDSMDTIPFFSTVEQGIDFLVRPLTGFYSAGDSVRRLRIWHPPVEPVSARVSKFDMSFLNLANITGDGIEFHSSVVVPDARFFIFMPPGRVR